MKILLKRTVWLAAATALWTGMNVSAFALSGDLQGLNRNDSTNWNEGSPWIGNNLSGWRELDLVPCRISLQGAASNSPVSITFPRTRKGRPAFENLFFISNSPNITVTQAPVLNAPADADEWSYSLAVTITGEEQGYIYFNARLSAGVQLNTGSSLQLRGEPSLSPLQIHKPRAALNKPDLGVTISGRTDALPGETIVYTISYTNQAAGLGDVAHTATLTVSLPEAANCVADSATAGGSIAGNSITWNLGDVASQQGGTVSFQVVVTPTVTLGAILTHSASIAAIENDLNPADNTSTVATTIAGNSPPNGGPLRITRIIKFDDEIYHVYFQTMPGRNYVIQYTEDFSEWTTDATEIPGSGTEVVSRQRQGGAKRFYRVMELP